MLQNSFAWRSYTWQYQVEFPQRNRKLEVFRHKEIVENREIGLTNTWTPSNHFCWFLVFSQLNWNWNQRMKKSNSIFFPLLIFWPGNKSNIGQKIFVEEEKWIIRGHIIVVLIMKEQEGSSSNARWRLNSYYLIVTEIL